MDSFKFARNDVFNRLDDMKLNYEDQTEAVNYLSRAYKANEMKIQNEIERKRQQTSLVWLPEGVTVEELKQMRKDKRDKIREKHRDLALKIIENEPKLVEREERIKNERELLPKRPFFKSLTEIEDLTELPKKQETPSIKPIIEEEDEKIIVPTESEHSSVIQLEEGEDPAELKQKIENKLLTAGKQKLEGIKEIHKLEKDLVESELIELLRSEGREKEARNLEKARYLNQIAALFAKRQGKLTLKGLVQGILAAKFLAKLVFPLKMHIRLEKLKRFAEIEKNRENLKNWLFSGVRRTLLNVKFLLDSSF